MQDHNMKPLVETDGKVNLFIFHDYPQGREKGFWVVLQLCEPGLLSFELSCITTQKPFSRPSISKVC